MAPGRDRTSLFGSAPERRDPTSVRAAAAVFRMLSNAYPARIRADWNAEAAEVFADACSDAHQRSGLAGVLMTSVRTLPAVLITAVAEHADTWRAAHPADTSSCGRLALICAFLALASGVVYGIDQVTPPQFSVSIIFGVLLFGAGALLPPRLAVASGLFTMAVYVIDDWVPDQWTVLRVVGFIAVMLAAVWALHLGAVHGRLFGRPSRRVS